MEEVIRVQDIVESGLYIRSIFGLNIFSANALDVEALDDPRIIFLRNMCRRNPASAHTGNLYDMADSPEEVFGAPGAAIYYTQVPIGIYGGMFYDIRTWPNFPGCFFPIVNNNFWEIGQTIGRSITDILELDAVALYVGYRNEIAPEIKSLFEKEFISHERWLAEVASIYDMIVISAADGGHFVVYSINHANFELLSPAISNAIESIRQHPWYKQNSSLLKWDEEYEMCLVGN